MKRLNLKAVVLTLSIATCVNSYAQTDSVYITKETDIMTEKTYCNVNRSFVCLSEDRKIGFKIIPLLKFEDGVIKPNDFYCKTINIGSCNEKDVLIILLDDGTKINSVSWKDFNCEGESYFKIKKSDIENLRVKKVSKIMVQNGRSYESYTHNVEDRNKDYFIKLLTEVNNNHITKIIK